LLPEGYLKISERVLLRRFEVPLAYKAKDDELYELDDEALEFLSSCDGENAISSIIQKFGEDAVRISLEEGLIEVLKNPEPNDIKIPESPAPSLRHMLIHVTKRCNLRCKHCYLSKEKSDMKLETFKLLIREFDRAGGLKIMISGGEPLLNPHIWKMLDLASDYDFRRVLITNGTLIDQKTAEKLDKVDEVQISIDGIDSNDKIRGEGSFEKAIDAVKILVERGMTVTVATMVHSSNIDEFEDMDRLFREIGVKRWLIDYPSITGELQNNLELLADVKRAAGIISKFSYGETGHKSHGEYSCGSHMCSSDTTGNISRCGFFEPVGNVREGLMKCWEKLNREYLWRLNELKCSCSVLESCKGGCRFRASSFGDILGPDPVMCEIAKMHGYIVHSDSLLNP
jgi:radical SAM protein with 4Fe4S-binding SPASM domain